jgi:hypothetical protein
MGEELEKELSSELQRLISLLGMQTSIYNIETRLGQNGKTYIMEVSPRGGGNRLAEVVRYATGVDMITNSVRAALGLKVEELLSWEYNGHWAEIILHSNQDGIFEGVVINDDVKPYVKELDLWLKPGDKIYKFSSARYAIGTLILCFPNEITMLEKLENQQSCVNVCVK